MSGVCQTRTMAYIDAAKRRSGLTEHEGHGQARPVMQDICGALFDGLDERPQHALQSHH